MISRTVGNDKPRENAEKFELESLSEAKTELRGE